MVQARAWAVVQRGELLVRTVNEARFGAIVAWLWQVPDVGPLGHWQDHVIVRIFEERAAAAGAEVVQVTVVADEGPAPVQERGAFGWRPSGKPMGD